LSFGLRVIKTKTCTILIGGAGFCYKIVSNIIKRSDALFTIPERAYYSAFLNAGNSADICSE
jgi:hypothetical protein